MKIRKSFAGIAAAGLAIAGVAVVTAPGAQAIGPNQALSLGCDVVGISTSLAAWNTTHTLTVNGNAAGATVNTGGAVTVDYNYTAGPNNGGPASTGRTQVVVELATAATGGTVVATQTSAWSAPVAVPGGGVFPGQSFSVNFTAPAAGTYFARIQNVKNEGYLGGGPGVGVLAAEVNCNGQLTFAGQAPAVNPTTTPVAFAGTNLTVVGPTLAPVKVYNLGSGAAVGGSGASIDQEVPGAVTAGVGTLRSADLVEVSATNFTNGGTVSFEECDAAGAGCTAIPAGNVYTSYIPAGPGTTGTVGVPTVSGGGFTAWVKVTSGVTGARSIKATSTTAGENARGALNFLGTRTLTISAPGANFGTGVTVTLSGSNWYPNEGIDIKAATCTGPPGPPCTVNTGAPADTIVAAATVDSAGNLSAQNKVNDAVTFSTGGEFVAFPKVGSPQFIAPTIGGTWNLPVSTGRSPRAAFTLSKSQCTSTDADGDEGTVGLCFTEQNVTATVNPGNLTQALGGQSITLPAVFTSTTPQPTSGALNENTITDLRGLQGTWVLTAKMSGPLAGNGTATGATIPANLLTLSGISCVEQGTSTALGLSNAATAGLDTAQAMCGDPTVNPATNSTSGQWKQNGTLNLSVPAYQQAGGYTGTLILTLT